MYFKINVPIDTIFILGLLLIQFYKMLPIILFLRKDKCVTVESPPRLDTE